MLGSTRDVDGLKDVQFCLFVRIETSADTGVDIKRNSCRNQPTAVHSDTHHTVCLDYDCLEVVRIPVDGSTNVRLETLKAYDEKGIFDWSIKTT
jgi:hypothetical protein